MSGYPFEVRKERGREVRIPVVAVAIALAAERQMVAALAAEVRDLQLVRDHALLQVERLSAREAAP